MRYPNSKITQFVVCAPQGTGKTYRSRKLAELLGCDFICDDDGRCIHLCTSPVGPVMQRSLILTSIMEFVPSPGTIIFKVPDRQGLDDLISLLSLGRVVSAAEPARPIY